MTYALISLFLLAGTGMFLAQRAEAKKWNNGICSATGQPWTLFDRDSQGGRGYKSGDNTLWVSYPWVDKA